MAAASQVKPPTTERVISGEARLRIAAGGPVYEDSSIWPSLQKKSILPRLARVQDRAKRNGGGFLQRLELTVLGLLYQRA